MCVFLTEVAPDCHLQPRHGFYITDTSPYLTKRLRNLICAGHQTIARVSPDGFRLSSPDIDDLRSHVSSGVLGVLMCIIYRRTAPMPGQARSSAISTYLFL